MNFFQRFFSAPVETSTPVDSSAAEPTAVEEPIEDISTDLTDMKLLLGRPGRESRHRASFDPQTATLTVERHKDDCDPTSYDLLRGKLKVAARSSYRNDKEPLIVITNYEPDSGQDDFYQLEVYRKDLIKYPAFAEAIRAVLLRSMFLHNSEVEVDVDTLTTTMEATFKYKALRRIFSLELSDLYFEDVDAETILAHTASTERQRVLSRESSGDPEREFPFISITQVSRHKVNLGGGGRAFGTVADVVRDKETHAVKGIAVEVTGGGVYVRYFADLDSNPTPEELRPMGERGSGLDIANWWMKKDFEMGDNPGDKFYARVITARAVRDFQDFYRSYGAAVDFGF